MTDTIRLLDEFTVEINGNGHSGKVYQLQVEGSLNDPDSVEVTLANGTKFTIPWEQYDR